MRTMKTPEMEVVRFNEADIIVASGLPAGAKINLSMGTSAPKDAVVSYNNKNYYMADYADKTYGDYENVLINAFGSEPLSAKMKGVTTAADNLNLSFSDLLQKEFNGNITNPGAWTTDFVYDGEKFTKVNN